MPDRLKKMYDPVKARWDMLTPPQRYKLFGVIAVVLLALILTLWLAFRTSWATIISGSNLVEIAPMRVALDDAGIANRVRSHGSVLQVDRSREHDATLAIHMAGAAPSREHFTWENALGMAGLGTTDAERTRLDILGMQGQLESQLVLFDGIVGADVTFTVPTTRPFDRNAPQPTAAVVVTTTRDFSPATGRNLAQFVANNVPRLTIENVSIMDHRMNSIWDGEQAAPDALDAAQQNRDRHTRHVEHTVLQVLAPVFDEVNVAYHPVFDERIMTEVISDIFSIPEGMDGGGIPLMDQGARREMEGLGGGWEPGLGPQAGAIPGYLMAGQNLLSANEREWLINYAVNHTRTAVTYASGVADPERSTITVSLIKEIPVYQHLWMSDPANEGATLEDWQRFKIEYATHPVMINSEYPDFGYILSAVANTANLPVENAFLMIHRRLVPIDDVVRPWDIPTILMVAVLLLLLAMLLIGLLRRQRAAGEDEEALEPQLAVEDLLVSTQLEEARDEAAAELEEIDYFKENEIKKHIEKFVNEKPEAVASLLRNWINVEEW